MIEDPDGTAIQLLSNSDFESGSTDWRLRGNHRHSEVITDPDDAGNQVLRLVATSVTEHMHNQVETTLAGGQAVVNGREYEISFRARWVTGTPLLHTRLYFARLAQAHVIDRPAHVGTPSAANSTAEPNIGPSIDGMQHSPVIPSAGEAITVTAQAVDPDGVSGMILRYSVNGGRFQSTPMVSGSGGIYQGTIPGQAAAVVVQFYVEASDSLAAISTFPAAGPDSRALIKVDDGLAATNGLHNFRALGTSDADPNDANENIFLHPGLGDNSVDYTLVKALTADDVVYTIQTSPDLVTWNNEDGASAALVDAVVGPSGRITETWQLDLPPGADRYFVRLSVSAREVPPFSRPPVRPSGGFRGRPVLPEKRDSWQSSMTTTAPMPLLASRSAPDDGAPALSLPGRLTRYGRPRGSEAQPELHLDL